MRPADETTDESQRVPELGHGALPGVVMVWGHGGPSSAVLPLERGQIVLGRGVQPDWFADDERASREHCRLEYDGRLWSMTDLGSRNGTFLNNVRLAGAKLVSGQPLFRIGRTLVWAVQDVRPHRSGVLMEDGGLVLGGVLKRAWAEIELAAHAGNTLCLRGESGSGKELAARAFHEAATGKSVSAPFVGVNCAAIPEGLAERLLFGARRGAYSGATADVQGYVQAAHRGTLFLDEIAELDLRVQAKLLRVLETREVLALGATKPEPVEIRVCVAAHADLRERVQAGQFREDLYYRVGRPEVKIAPLRERLDELPWLIDSQIRAHAPELRASARLVEACAERPWPGNVRELIGEVRRAAHRAQRAGRDEVDAADLDADAGLRLADSAPEEAELPTAEFPDSEQIQRVLSETGGNVTRAARQLGLHRNQLRRWLAKNATVPTTEPESKDPA